VCARWREDGATHLRTVDHKGFFNPTLSLPSQVRQNSGNVGSDGIMVEMVRTRCVQIPFTVQARGYSSHRLRFGVESASCQVESRCPAYTQAHYLLVMQLAQHHRRSYTVSVLPDNAIAAAARAWTSPPPRAFARAPRTGPTTPAASQAYPGCACTQGRWLMQWLHVHYCITA
jgi:hypothetical protein